jgi:hypothetical protein
VLTVQARTIAILWQYFGGLQGIICQTM